MPAVKSLRKPDAGNPHVRFDEGEGVTPLSTLLASLETRRGDPLLEIAHKEITQQIIGAAFEVYKILGYGFLEKVYQRAMQVELQRRGLRAELERKITVHY